MSKDDEYILEEVSSMETLVYVGEELVGYIRGSQILNVKGDRVNTLEEL